MASGNDEVVEWLGSHLGLALDRKMTQAVAGGQFDWVWQALTLGSVCQMRYQFFLDQWKKVKTSLH